MSMLEFVVIAPDHIPSFDPDESDMLRNAVVMEQLVGTLVKERHGNTGRSEPYLAESWNVSSDKLTWDFFLRTGMTAEDGSPIDAISFAKSLHRRLKALGAHHDVPAFNMLNGWRMFYEKKADYISGIEVVGKLHLRLKFNSPAHGVLEYLAMPTFGYFSESNFLNGKWAAKNRIISSGSYRIIEPFKAGVLTLVQRDAALKKDPAAPGKVRFHFIDWKSALSLDRQSTIISSREIPRNNLALNGFTEIPGAPIFLTALVVSSASSNPLFDLETRRAFVDRVRELAASESVFQGLLKKRDFYPTAPAPTELYANQKHSPYQHHDKAGAKIRIGYDSINMSPEREQALSLAAQASRDFGLDPELIPFDKTNPDWLKKVNSNQSYDIRLASVDIGGGPENWVIKMMFCSTLGVSFPDPSKRICELTNLIEKDPAAISSEDYNAKFNTALIEDASVIPLYHTGFTWFMGNRIDLSEIESTLVVPRIENIKLK
jgi:ABC-type transport system substrate-binding protein